MEAPPYSGDQCGDLTQAKSLPGRRLRPPVGPPLAPQPVGNLPSRFDEWCRDGRVPPRRCGVATRRPIGADRMFIDAPPALPTVLMLTNLRARLERQKPRDDADPSPALLLGATFVFVGLLLGLVGF